MASFIHEKWLNCEILIDTIHTDILPVYGVELWISYLIHLLSIWDFRMRQEMRPLSKQWKTLFNQRIEISAIYSTTVLYDFQAISICHFWHCREPRLRYSGSADCSGTYKFSFHFFSWNIPKFNIISIGHWLWYDLWNGKQNGNMAR